MKFLSTKIKDIKSTLNSVLPANLVENFFKLNENRLYAHYRNQKFKLKEKLNRLRNKQELMCSLKNIDSGKWLINTSDKVLPKEVQIILSLGDRFALPILSNNKADRIGTIVTVIQNFEYKFFTLPDNIINEASGTICLILKTFFSKSHYLAYIERYINSIFIHKNFKLL